MRTFSFNNNIFEEVKSESIDFNSLNYTAVFINSDELKEIQDKFNIKEELVVESNNKRHDTKISLYNDYNYCVFNEIEVTKEKTLINEIDVIYSNKYIILATKDNSKTFNTLLKMIENNENALFNNCYNPCNKILYLILDILFSNYIEGIISLEKHIENIEEDVLKQNVSQFINKFIYLRRQVLSVVRYISPLEYLIDLIRLNENNIIDKEMYKYFENIEIKYDKLGSNIVMLNESIAYLREAYEAEVSNKSNYVMQIFTIISAIFLPLTLITGIFGMNFENTPFLNYKYGFHVLIALMLFISFLLINLFRKKNWI